MKKLVILILLLTLIALTGCQSSPYTFEARKISIDTNPPGARVYQLNSAFRNETFLGTTPIKDQPVSILVGVKGKVTPTNMDWYTSQKTMLNVRIEKPGYQTYEGNLATDMEKTLKHEIPLSNQ